jgi:hypothetical protein
MPVFINEVVITAEIDSATPPVGAAPAPPAVPLKGEAREALIEEVSAEVFRRLERALDRMGER